MDVLLAPVYQSFLSIKDRCLDNGGFVVGPMGAMTAEALFEFAHSAGRREAEFPSRFHFDRWLPGAIYESHTSVGEGGFHYVGLIDEIEINAANQPYRFPKMKPGEGHHGEEKYDERMPAFVRFRVVKRVADVLSGATKLWPKDLGLTEGVLRHFKIGSIRKTALREAFEGMRSP